MDPFPRWIVAIPSLVTWSFVTGVVSYLLFNIVKAHRKTTDHQQRIYCTAILFMFVNWLTAICFLSVHAYNLGIYVATGYVVKPFSRYLAWGLISLLLIVLQNYLLLIALFIRLRGLFKSSPVPLSKCVIVSYALALTILPFLCFSFVLAAPHGEIVVRVLLGAALFMFIALLVSLLALFTRKLAQIQRNKTLSAFINRQITLAVFTVVDILLILGIVALAPVLREDTGPERENYSGYTTVGYLWIFINGILLFPFNVLCNFLCIALSYRCCDSMIVLCCGCLRCCRVIPITTEEHDAIFLEQIFENADKARDAKPRNIAHHEPEIIKQPVDSSADIVMTVPHVPPMNMNRMPAAPTVIIYQYQY